jgi:2-polyprenyl-3-methyl-5-hydroxy-6-metoxy-1,4-benzoquinol methylase
MNPWRVLDNPVVWEISRVGLNLSFGLYRKRIKAMRNWGVLQDRPSVLDIGCGIGQYADVTEGAYLGVDFNQRYIDYAHSKRRRPNQCFRCMDVTTILDERSTFDVVLMVDFLHHIPDEQCVRLLDIASRLAGQYVVSFEPITNQYSPIGQWIVDHDQGNYVRPLGGLHHLFEQSRLEIVESTELRLGPINSRAIMARPPRSGDVQNVSTGNQVVYPMNRQRA